MKASTSIILKLLFLFFFIYTTNQGVIDRIKYLLETDNTVTLAVFTVLWVISIGILLIVSFHRGTLVRIFWAVLISFTTAISYGFYQAGGSELEVLDILELWQARHETARALEHFQYPLIKAILIALLGFIVISYPVKSLRNKKQKLFSIVALLPLIPVFLFSTLIFIKSDKAIAGLPQQFAPASMAAAISYKMAKHEIPTRNQVNDAPTASPKAKHLLYLVDESINPNYIYTETGNLLEGFAQHQNKIADFGASISGSNCSARSNAILRLGATKENLINSVKQNSTIWQYAKKAGFRTVYIDSQATGLAAAKPNDFQNYMTQDEANYIDVFYKVKNVPAPELDYKLLEIVKNELANDTPTFIFANKNGAHFPYSHNYPKSEAIFQPTPNEDTTTFNGLINLFQQENGLELLINTYMNSVSWTVDKFFKKFFNDINLDNTVVIYTSDHGQYFDTSGTTHCTSGDGAPALEGIVPLMLMSSNDQLLSEFKLAAKMNYGNTDHFLLFPTLLNLFGYSKDIQNSYGPNLFDASSNETSAFNTGDILGIISTDTIWREVSKEELMKQTPMVPRVKNHVSQN